MSGFDPLTYLSQIPLLQGFSDAHLDRLAKIARCVEVSKDTTIFRAGDVASNVYIVVGGRVALEICAPGVGCKRILTVSDGDLLGWSPLLENEYLTASARTLIPTRVLEIAGDELRKLCDADPRLGYAFMRCVALALGKRLNATRMQLLDLYGHELPVIPEGRDREGAP